MTVKVDEKKTGGPDEALKLENQLCFPLYACAKEVVRRYRKPLAELGLTYTQYIVMMVLWEFGDMSEGQLGCRLHLDSGTLAPLLKRLEKTGLIDRRRPEDDERMLMVSLTEKGVKAYHHHLDFHKNMMRAIVRDLNDEEKQALHHCLVHLEEFFRSIEEEKKA